MNCDDGNDGNLKLKLCSRNFESVRVSGMYESVEPGVRVSMYEETGDLVEERSVLLEDNG